MLSSNPKHTPNALSEAALRQFIRKALEKGWVREAFHSEFERAYRNISDDDVRHALSSKDWTLERQPAWSEEHKNFVYVVRSADVEGEELHLVVTPNVDTGTLKIITKY